MVSDISKGMRIQPSESHKAGQMIVYSVWRSVTQKRSARVALVGVS